MIPEELRKRLEEAAKQYALNKLGDQFQDEYPHRRRTFAVHSNLELDDAFVDGAEFCYKEVIAQAKEWLRYNVHRYIYAVNEDGIPRAGIGAAAFSEDFEIEMNKLWEEKK
jgi:hypothetical protein